MRRMAMSTTKIIIKITEIYKKDVGTKIALNYLLIVLLRYNVYVLFFVRV